MLIEEFELITVLAVQMEGSGSRPAMTPVSASVIQTKSYDGQDEGFSFTLHP